MRRESLNKVIWSLYRRFAPPLIALYFISMVIYPWIQGGGAWKYVHAVWSEWQSLNVGVLAFISSYIAFNISTFNEEKKREREFVAARAFLPQALSDLTGYCKRCAELLREAYTSLDHGGGRPNPLKTEAPVLPEGVNETFSRCIAAAEPDVASYLAKVLMKLQIVNARARQLKGGFGIDYGDIRTRSHVMWDIDLLGELQVLINRIFNYARDLEKFDDSKPTWEDYINAFGNLKIDIEDIAGLEEFTKGRIARGN